jgi:hypothetical protein
MSKFAMHRSNPLQYDAILLVNFNVKSPLAYSPNLPSVYNMHHHTESSNFMPKPRGSDAKP